MIVTLQQKKQRRKRGKRKLMIAMIQILNERKKRKRRRKASDIVPLQKAQIDEIFNISSKVSFYDHNLVAKCG